ncbi:hypothetical protein MRB53_025227 [Persea americana]|uniref:Uncharacterized protein n=1 Tax=Persea americana TaxID=3435 RepID=A0ACC2LEN4_PERAE|nr:hypothetical protein MRB53_025227 [Persea americana]
MDAEASSFGLNDKPPHVLAATTEEEGGPSRPTWNPFCYAFGPYLPPSTSYAGTSQSQQRSSSSSSSLRAIVKKPLVARLTKDIVETYQICNPAFKYSEAINLKRFLTNPSVGVLNDGFDNANSDLILTVNFVLVNDSSQQRFVFVALSFMAIIFPSSKLQ